MTILSLAKARTQYRNIIETLDGKIVAGNEHWLFCERKGYSWSRYT